MLIFVTGSLTTIWNNGWQNIMYFNKAKNDVNIDKHLSKYLERDLTSLYMDIRYKYQKILTPAEEEAERASRNQPQGSNETPNPFDLKNYGLTNEDLRFKKINITLNNTKQIFIFFINKFEKGISTIKKVTYKNTDNGFLRIEQNFHTNVIEKTMNFGKGYSFKIFFTKNTGRLVMLNSVFLSNYLNSPDLISISIKNKAQQTFKMTLPFHGYPEMLIRYRIDGSPETGDSSQAITVGSAGNLNDTESTERGTSLEEELENEDL